MHNTQQPSDDRLAVEVVAGLERLITLFRSLNSPSELSLTAAATLATLERSGPHRLTWLAASEGVTQPGMTQLISRLQDAGLVERVADPADGRAVQVRVTALGVTTLVARRAARAQRLVGMLSQLPPTQRSALAAALPAIDALTSLGLQPDSRAVAGRTATERTAAEQPARQRSAP
jgi:DNA-binding MarR family transcriptional regulator